MSHRPVFKEDSMNIFVKYLVLGILTAMPFATLAPVALGFDRVAIEQIDRVPLPNCCGAYCSSVTNNKQCKDACKDHCSNSNPEKGRCELYCDNHKPNITDPVSEEQPY